MRGCNSYGKLYKVEWLAATAAVSEGRITAAAALLYATLVTFRNDNTGKTIPLHSKAILNASGINRSTFYRLIKSLQNLGFITKVSKNAKGVVYGFPYWQSLNTETLEVSQERPLTNNF
jgi:hypothetical protein